MKCKSLFFILALLIFTASFSQTELSKKGIITTAVNEKINFNNLRLTSGKFVFVDVNAGAEKELAISEVKFIEDDRHSRVFTNKTVVDATKEADEKALQEERIKNAQIFEKIKQKQTNDPVPLQLYPDGLYKTKQDFLNKTPSSVETVIPKGLIGLEKKELSEITDNCFFYYLNTDSKVKNTFAISYKGHLYIQIYAILENRNKTDRAQSNDFPNSFVRVVSAGQNYYYLEAGLVNQWVQGVALNTGATGVLIAQDLSSANIQTGKTQSFGSVKGIVWDIKNKEFNIFKNCKDYNDFIKDKYPEGVQECKNQQPDILEVREAIEKIK
jgi:hypothetical protein